MDLQKAYSGILTQGGQLLSNIGKGVSSAVGNVGNAIGNEIHQLPQQVNQAAPHVANFLFNNNPWNQQLPQIPKVTLPTMGNNTPLLQRLGYNYLAKPIAENVINTPSDLVQASNANNQMMSQVMQGKQIPTSQFIGNLGRTGAAVLNTATFLPGGAAEGAVKDIAANAVAQGGWKQAGQDLVKASFKGGVQGGGFTGLYGFLQGLANNQNQGVKNQVLNALVNGIESIPSGFALGTVTAGAANVVGQLKNRITALRTAQGVSPVQAAQDADAYLRNRLGQFIGLKPKATFQTAGMEGKISTPNQPIKVNDWMDNVDKQIGWDKNNKPSIGLSVKTLSKEEHLANQPVGGSEPLPWENAQGQTLPEFASKEQNPGVKIPTDEATVQRATADQALGSQVGKETKQTFADWVNQRKATKVEGLLKQREFSDLNNKGINGIFEFQSGNKTGRFGDVQKYFDQKYNEVKKAGIELNYKKDYLPQLWNNSQQEVEQVFGRSLGTKPSFSMDSIIKNYEEGIKAGLTPKFSTIGDLAGWYEQRANKAIADMNFFTKLGKDGFIQPAGKAPRDWVSLNPDTFPKVKTNINGETYNGVYKAPRELADMINNYLYSPANGNTFSRALNGIANFVSRAKNITLSFGVPGTGINAHGFNILARHTLGGTGGNPITRLLTGTKYMLHPGSAVAELDKTLETAPEAVKNGLTLSAEEHTALLNQSETFAKSFGKNWNNLFEKPLFNKMIPALKLSSYNELVKNGTDAKAAAKLVNNVYGGMNWEQLGRSRDYQNFLRTIILAPDWAESTVRLGGNLGKSFVPTLQNGKLGFLGGETGARYRTMATTILGSYVALNIANKLTSGHYAFQNDPGHTFELEAGYTQDGQKRYLKPYGTSVDFLRLPFDTAVGLAQGDPTPAFRAISNRLSIPLGAAMHLLTNTDYKGQAIYGQDKYGNKMTPLQSAEGVGAQVIGAAGLPSFIQNAGDVATGKQGVEEGLTQGLELPFRYSNLGHSNIAQQLDPSVNLQGKDLYDFNKQLQGQSKFSDNQMIGVNQSTNKKQTIQDMLDVRKMTSDENKVKKQLLQGGQADSGVTQAQAAEKVVNNKIYYTSAGSVKTIDLNPPTKGSGIDAYTNQNWQYAKAREVFASPISDAQKQAAYTQLGVTPSQVEYDYKASKSTDIKSQYVLDKAKTMSHQDLVNQMVKGRQESISGTQFANNGVIDALNQAGYLSNAEAKGLKSLKYDKNGNQIAKVSSGKVSAGSLPKIPRLHLVTPRAAKVKASRTTTYTLKAPKLNIAPIPRFGSSVPKARKIKLSA